MGKVRVSVTQPCLALCDPMDCSLPGSSVHGILQARILQWVAMPFSEVQCGRQGLQGVGGAGGATPPSLSPGAKKGGATGEPQTEGLWGAPTSTGVKEVHPQQALGVCGEPFCEKDFRPNLETF